MDSTLNSLDLQTAAYCAVVLADMEGTGEPHTHEHTHTHTHAHMFKWGEIL